MRTGSGAWFRFLATAVLAGAASGAAADPADEALELLNQRYVPFTSEEFADLVDRGDEELVRVFLQAGMNPNTEVRRGVSALIHATIRGHERTAEELLQGGAFPNLKDAQGWTALHFSAFFSRGKIMELLLAHKADVEAENGFGVTALYLATQRRNPELIGMLLANKARADHAARSGATPLSLAVDMNEKAVLKLFEKHGYAGRIRDLKARYTREDAARRKDAEKRAAERDKKMKERLDAVKPDS